jgi:hypothetical protein
MNAELMEPQTAGRSAAWAHFQPRMRREDFELTCRGAADPIALLWYDFDTRFYGEREIQTIYGWD